MPELNGYPRDRLAGERDGDTGRVEAGKPDQSLGTLWHGDAVEPPRSGRADAVPSTVLAHRQQVAGGLIEIVPITWPFALLREPWRGQCQQEQCAETGQTNACPTPAAEGITVIHVRKGWLGEPTPEVRRRVPAIRVNRKGYFRNR